MYKEHESDIKFTKVTTSQLILTSDSNNPSSAASVRYVNSKFDEISNSVNSTVNAAVAPVTTMMMQLTAINRTSSATLTPLISSYFPSISATSETIAAGTNVSNMWISAIFDSGKTAEIAMPTSNLNLLNTESSLMIMTMKNDVSGTTDLIYIAYDSTGNALFSDIVSGCGAAVEINDVLSDVKITLDQNVFTYAPNDDGIVCANVSI